MYLPYHTMLELDDKFGDCVEQLYHLYDVAFPGTHTGLKWLPFAGVAPHMHHSMSVMRYTHVSPVRLFHLTLQCRL